MKLRELLAAVPGVTQPSSHSALDSEVKGLTTNSLACQPGDLFIGMPGTRVDGGEFWPSAIASGAVAALVSPTAAQKRPHTDAEAACVIPAADMVQACAQVAAAFYDYPAQKLQLVGVTGTNGKTTTVTLLNELFAGLGYKTGLISTFRFSGLVSFLIHKSICLERTW